MGGFRFGTGFEVGGERCDAWLYRPVDADDPPVVVMAHGFAAERSWGLAAFARRFAARGLAALVFDYRGFGASDGHPRRVVTPRRQLADWRAAVAHARALERVGGRIALWGTSFGAGHALATAAAEPVDALALQVPFLDGRAQARLHLRRGGLRWARWAAVAGLRDRLRAAIRRAPHYVPVAGGPDDRAVINAPGAAAGYEALVPDDEDWPNRCAARILLSVPFYRPLARAGAVDCPALVVQADDDRVVPAGPVDRLVDRLDDVERVRYDVGHFDVYGEAFQRVADREAGFLRRHLPS